VLLMMDGGTARNMYIRVEIDNQKYFHPVGCNYKIRITCLAMCYLKCTH